MDNERKRIDWKKPPKWYTIVEFQILAVGIVLIIFALFHHVIPKKGQEEVVSTMPTVAPVETPVPVPQETAAPTIEPTPVQYAQGDFSANFPNYDTGTGAAYSYQTDDIRIAITRNYTVDTSYLWADVWVRDLKFFRTAMAKNEFGTGIVDWPVNIANDVGAVFAVTGDYFGARHEGLVIRNGSRYRSSISSDVCVLFADGTMQTYKQDEFSLKSIEEKGIWQAWSFGPSILDDGQAITEFNSAIKVENPRTAIGYYEPGHYCFCVVDGRQESSEGMTLAELSELFASNGCKAAFNLDGGQTSAMIFQGEVINSPCDGGRKSSDIICFGGNNE